ncbi:MAG: hypothetical protein ACPG49_03405 [Chitinophagales bacterium]
MKKIGLLFTKMLLVVIPTLLTYGSFLFGNIDVSAITILFQSHYQIIISLVVGCFCLVVFELYIYFKNKNIESKKTENYNERFEGLKEVTNKKVEKIQEDNNERIKEIYQHQNKGLSRLEELVGELFKREAENNNEQFEKLKREYNRNIQEIDEQNKERFEKLLKEINCKNIEAVNYTEACTQTSLDVTNIVKSQIYSSIYQLVENINKYSFKTIYWTESSVDSKTTRKVLSKEIQSKISLLEKEVKKPISLDSIIAIKTSSQS